MSLFTRMVDQGVMGVCLYVFGDPIGYAFKETPDDFFVITGIFEAEGVVVDTAGEIPVETRRPVLCIRKTDFSNAGYRLPKQSDLARINGVVYSVVHAAQTDDGQAEMRLVLMAKGNYD